MAKPTRVPLVLRRNHKKPGWSCTNLDHIYPADPADERVRTGTRCYCGKRTWGQDNVLRPHVFIPLAKIRDGTRKKLVLPRKGVR